MTMFLEVLIVVALLLLLLNKMARAYNIDPTDTELNSTQAERERERNLYIGEIISICSECADQDSKYGLWMRRRILTIYENFHFLCSHCIKWHLAVWLQFVLGLVGEHYHNNTYNKIYTVNVSGSRGLETSTASVTVDAALDDEVIPHGTGANKRREDTESHQDEDPSSSRHGCQLQLQPQRIGIRLDFARKERRQQQGKDKKKAGEEYLIYSFAALALVCYNGSVWIFCGWIRDKSVTTQEQSNYSVPKMQSPTVGPT